MRLVTVSSLRGIYAEAIQTFKLVYLLDCFVASLLAMTDEVKASLQGEGKEKTLP